MKKSYFLLIVVGLILLSAIVLRVIGFGSDKVKTTGSENTPIPMVGNDRDAHGCIPSAGYSWCEIKNKCLRNWEEKCEEEKNIVASSTIVNEAEASFLKEIMVINPKQNEVVTSPLKIQGSVVGSWFFEASLPIKLVDSENKLIASGVAKPDADPLTEKPIPFSASLDFSTTATSGYLIISNDNPSGLPEYSKSISLPVKFK